MPILIPEPHDEICFRKDGKRLDGRDPDEIRPFSAQVGVIKNAQGSAFVQHGGNQIYAAVYGPREVHPRHMAKPDTGILRVYYRMATFSVHERKSPAPNRRENEISKVIREALEPVLFLEAYPDSQIEVFIEVIAADGGTRCASTTAASLALADAGIPMRSMIVGVAAGKAQGKIVLDLNDKEDKVGQADMPCVVIMKDKHISLLQFDGDMSLDEMQLAFQYIMKGAEDIYQKQLEALHGKYKNIQEKVQVENEALKKQGAAITLDDEADFIASEDNQPQEDFSDQPDLESFNDKDQPEEEDSEVNEEDIDDRKEEEL